MLYPLTITDTILLIIRQITIKLITPSSKVDQLGGNQIGPDINPPSSAFGYVWIKWISWRIENSNEHVWWHTTALCWHKYISNKTCQQIPPLPAIEVKVHPKQD